MVLIGSYNHVVPGWCSAKSKAGVCNVMLFLFWVFVTEFVTHLFITLFDNNKEIKQNEYKNTEIYNNLYDYMPGFGYQ